MRKAVIERDGVHHYALHGWDHTKNYPCWFVFCDESTHARRIEYDAIDIQINLPTCVRCLGEEALRGKDLEPIYLKPISLD